MRIFALLAEFSPVLLPILGGIYLFLLRGNDTIAKWKPTIDVVLAVLGLAVALNWLYGLKASDPSPSQQTPQTVMPQTTIFTHEYVQTHLSVRTCPKANDTCLIKGILETGSKVKVLGNKNTTIVESDGTKTPWTYIELVSGKVCSLTEMVNRTTCTNWRNGVYLDGWVNYTKLSTTAP